MLWLTALYLRMITPREHEDRGATMVEYGLIVGAIALTVVVGAALFGDALSDVFSDMVDKL